VCKHRFLFSFDFSGKSGPIPLDDQTVRKANSLRSGHSSAVFMWWDLKMDPEHKITLSCAPHWAHPLGKVAASQQVSGGGGQVGFSHDNNSGVPWRDHWMQSVYYPVSTDHVVAACGEEICVISNHDEFSLWFDVRKESPLGDVPMPDPTCGIHLAVSRSRLGQMNDPSRNSTLMASLKKAIAGLDAPPTCLCLSELSLMPLLACKLGAAKVYVAEENRQMRDVLEKYAKENGLGKKLVVLEKSVAELKGDEWSGEKVNA
jgi:protein arginine N-methyltransferase 7